MPSQATRPPLVGMPAVWLRDNCPCPLCRDPVSGQRLLHITDIPADIAVAEVIPSAGTVSVLFHPDGHRAVFDRDWLARHGEPGRGGPADPRSLQPVRLPGPRAAAFYAAYRAFAELLSAPPSMLTVRLLPGDCAVFDNTRVLHARTGFAQGGRRQLQGCYADLDGRRVGRGGGRTCDNGCHPQEGPDMTAADPVRVIADLFAVEGAGEYLGEPVTQAQHMLRAAALAEGAGAGPELVAAALLHDVGHFRGAVSGRQLMGGQGNRHGDQGADWLAQWFGPGVTEPVRLHVAAKRYLCAVEPDYFGGLSAASVHTLRIQGGAMTPAETAEFEASPWCQAALRLRRWDDAAKDPEAVVPAFGYYQRLLRQLVRQREAGAAR